MGKKNDFLARKKEKERLLQEATRQTFVQYMTDTLILTLNDPDVMGKDVFGYVRLKKVLDAWGKCYDQFFDALTKNDEADYARVKMVAGDQIWRQVKQGPHREHFPALWRALPFVLPPIPPQRSRSFPGLTMRSQVLQSAIFSCIMQTAYRFVGVELRFRHPASRKHGGCDVHSRRDQRKPGKAGFPVPAAASGAGNFVSRWLDRRSTGKHKKDTRRAASLRVSFCVSAMVLAGSSVKRYSTAPQQDI